MNRTNLVLIVVAGMVAAAGGALLISHQLRAGENSNDPVSEAQDLIDECYRKIGEIQGKLTGFKPSQAAGS